MLPLALPRPVDGTLGFLEAGFVVDAVHDAVATLCRRDAASVGAAERPIDAASSSTGSAAVGLVDAVLAVDDAVADAVRRQAFPSGASHFRRLPNVSAFEGAIRRAVPGFASDFVDARVESPGLGRRRGYESGLDVARVAVADAVADLVLAHAASSVVLIRIPQKSRPLTRASTGCAIALVDAAGAIGSAVADERLRDASVLRLAEEASRAPKTLQLVVDRILVEASEAARDAEVAALVLVRFVLAVGLTVASKWERHI